MTIELYAFPPSPRAFKVMAIANHLGLDWTLRFIDLRKGDQKAPEYAALNPNMRMPTLKEGDYVLWESSAIGQYLASKRPGSGLFPADERARLDVNRWQFWEHAHWDPACAVFAFEYVAKALMFGNSEPDQAALAKGTEAFHRVAKVLDGHLKGRKFVTGDTLTLADFGIGSALNLAEMAHYPVEPYGEIKRWYRDLSALPAWQKTLAQCAMPAAAAA
jgi:glutathione S-transferase